MVGGLVEEARDAHIVRLEWQGEREVCGSGTGSHSPRPACWVARALSSSLARAGDGEGPRHPSLRLLLAPLPGLGPSGPHRPASGPELSPADASPRLWPEPHPEPSPTAQMFPFSGSRRASWKNHGASPPQSTFERREGEPFSPVAAGTWLPAPGARRRLPIHAALVCSAGSRPEVPAGRWVGRGEGVRLQSAPD